MTAWVWVSVVGLFGAIPLVAYILGRKSGKAQVEKAVAEKTVDILRKQDQAAAKAPKTKDELVDRLRKGGF